MYQNAAGSIIKRYLEVLDDLERALKNRPQDGEGAAWAEGIELIYRKLPGAAGGRRRDSRCRPKASFSTRTCTRRSRRKQTRSWRAARLSKSCKQGYLLGDRVLRPAAGAGSTLDCNCHTCMEEH